MSGDYKYEKSSASEMQRRVADLYVDKFSLDEASAMSMASSLWCGIYLNYGMFFDRKRDIAALEKFERSLRAALTAIEDEMSERASDVLIGLSYGHGLGSFLENANSLCADARNAREFVNTSELTRDKVSRMNEPAIKLVDYSRGIWKAQTGSPAPRKYPNPASRFGKFLSDLFEKLEIEGNPQSAFRAWAKHIGDHEVDT
ncbi:hypothetical protein RAZWK3B_19241 [Roseobacter sp. AzwK-3b]|uniref:hypothetical protein n=1 Tax=Roseobacter sp. AzwK-3b TaxID=351016 RepID=UPI0001568AD1|nr:hypothetical protein [Roseobacter sp. AzwK-3b]EDM71519.1 hypothetical protein RAZWK3B_19241 [Roseobacter sp. AzwK-3b]